jgi:hypothetical protein
MSDRFRQHDKARVLFVPKIPRGIAMAKLPKFTLGYDKAQDAWQLRNGAKHVVRSFDTKTEAIKGGVLEKTVGTGGGSVQIRKLDGTIQEERTYPGSADPKRSPG